MSIPTVTKEDFEADDILATLAKQGAAQGYRVLVVSGDRDAIQLIDDDVTLLYPSRQGVTDLTRYDRDKVFERYGIEPHQYPDVAALVGETSDNLIGIDKVGEKTAVKWIKLYGGLDGILEHADEIKGVVGEKLREQKDNAIRNRKLNKLLNDVELPVGPADLERRPIDEAAVRTVFDKLQFRTLLERVLKVAAAAGEAVNGLAVDSLTTTDDASVPAVVPPVRTLVDDELAEWIEQASAEGTNPLALQPEFGPNGLSGFGLASADDTAYVPWAPGTPAAALTKWLASPAPKYVIDAKRQLKALCRVGLEFSGLAFDTTLAAWLLKPGGQPQNLAAQVYSYLGATLPQSDPNQLVPETEPVSVATEAWYILQVADYLAGKLDAGSRRVLDEIELPLVSVLADMELTGVTINRTILGDLSEELAGRIHDLAQSAYAEIGHEVNLGSPKQLQQVLFEELGMPKTRANKTGHSTDAASLADLQEQHPHPFLDLLLQHRDATKLRQIIETLEKSIGDDGRVHTRYDQTGTSTGRISSIDPNLQNIPVRAEEGRRIRAAFEAGAEFETLLTVDYSQIEMRIMAHLSGDAGLIEAFRSGEDLHRFVGARIFGVTPAEVTPAMRTKVKAMSYGLAYGLSPFGLSKQLRIDTRRGEAADGRLLPALRRGARLPARRRRAGPRRRLHRDDLRPSPPVHRSQVLQPGAARERRTGRAQRADPGLRRRHHEDRDARRRPRHEGAEAGIPDAAAGARRAHLRGREGGIGTSAPPSSTSRSCAGFASTPTTGPARCPRCRDLRADQLVHPELAVVERARRR